MQLPDTILIIDDDLGLCRSLRACLEGQGLAVAEASSGAEGLRAAERISPSLILVDIKMPGMDGFEACRRIRAMPGLEDTPLVVMSGLLGTSQKQKAFLAGAVDCLDKPLSYEEVALRVKTHLENRRQRMELRRNLVDAAAMNRSLQALNGKLRHSEQVKTRFLALMRNEINNPLNDIIGLAEEIADPALPADQGRRLAALVKDEAFRLDRQIRNVFTAAELEAGEVRPFLARVEVPALVRDVIEAFWPAARARGLRLEFEEAGADPVLATDGALLHHIVANLVGNAVQHGTPPGPVRVRVTAAPDQVTIAVSDQGPGIAAADQAALFEPFRIAGEGFRTQRGQGLGLPVARTLAEVLGGALRVESEPGRGSTFQVTLPRTSILGDLAAESAGGVLFFDDPQEF